MEPKIEVSDVITSWYFDPDTKAQALPQGQKYVLLPASTLDKAKVVSYYLPHPVPGYSIKQVEVIYNPKFNRSFSLQLDKLEERHENSAFTPKWSTMAYAPLRQKTYETFVQWSTPHTDTHYPHVKLLPAWHGTKPEVLDSIFRAGYANLATTDAGFFGRGYYSALEAEYAFRVYNEGDLLLNWVACFSPLPIVEDDMQALDLVGRANYGNYDAHFIPVISKNPKNPHDMSYFPCTAQQKAQYHELVVFESTAILPRYLVQLQPNHVKTLSPPEVPGETAYIQGLQAYHHARYHEAKVLFEEAAAQAYPAAYLWLGRLYQQNGLIGPKNEILSAQWYQKVQSTIDWFHTQAQTGRPDAQSNLGWCYLFGMGVEENEAEAVRYYRLAAEQGDADAQFDLGVCYLFGMGVEENEAEAVRYYRLAAEQGHADAQFDLGMCYAKGKRVEKNEAEAVRYYRLAAEQGHPAAQTQLEKLLQQHPHLKSVSNVYTPRFFPAAPLDLPVEEPTMKNKTKNQL